MSKTSDYHVFQCEITWIFPYWNIHCPYTSLSLYYIRMFFVFVHRIECSVQFSHSVVSDSARLECSEFYFRFIKRELNVYPYKHYRLDIGFDKVEKHCFRNCHHFFCFPFVHWLLISRIRDRIFWPSLILNERCNSHCKRKKMPSQFEMEYRVILPIISFLQNGSPRCCKRKAICPLASQRQAELVVKHYEKYSFHLLRKFTFVCMCVLYISIVVMPLKPL